MSFQLSELGNYVTTALASIAGATVTYFATKKKMNTDKVESADANGKLEALDIFKAMVEDRDRTIAILNTRNEELYAKNMELFNANQKLMGEIGSMKLQIRSLEQQVKELTAQMGGRRKDDARSN